MQNSKTNYPHLDKPWQQYYTDEQRNQEMPKKTLYENMRDNVQNYLNNTAITYNGETISYYEMLEQVLISAKILTAIDVKSNDRVLYLMANIPEIAYTLYGNNYIGGVSDYADPRPDSVDPKVSSKKILEVIKKEKIKHIVALDQCYLVMIKPIENELKELGISDVLLISANDSMTQKGKLNYIDEYIKFNGVSATLKKLKKLKVIQEKIDEAVRTSILDINYYKDMKNNISTIKPEFVGYSPDRLTAITHSSGTTGTFPKAIPLTNESIMSYAFQLTRSNTNWKQGDSNLQILPFFSAYGLGLGNFGYSNAYNMIQVPEFDPKNLCKMIKKYHPNALMGTPNWYLSMPTDKSLRNEDLSFIHIIGFGGDSMNPEDELNINEFLKKHNCSESICKGHGMSEISGGSSYAISEYNIPGSMGIPMVDTIYAVVDPDTKELIKFEDGKDTIQGEFIISSPAIVKETLDGNTVIKHGIYDGIDFVYTGDIGIMDRNGVLYFLARKDRAFTRYDGFKVKPFEIENIIKSHNEIKDCIITPFTSELVQGNLIQANIILENNNANNLEIIINDIVEKCFIKNFSASSRQIPSRFVIKTNYPLTMNGKVDYKKLSSYENEDIVYEVTCDETSISIDNIQIKKINNGNQKVRKK